MLYDNRKSRSHSLFLLFSAVAFFHIDCYRSSILNLCMLKELDHRTLSPSPQDYENVSTPFPFPTSYLSSTRRKDHSLSKRTTGTVPFTLVSQILVKTSRAMTRRHHLHFVAHRSSFIEARALTDFQRSL